MLGLIGLLSLMDHAMPALGTEVGELFKKLGHSLLQLEVPATPTGEKRSFARVPGETAARVSWYEDLADRGYRRQSHNAPSGSPSDTVFVSLSNQEKLNFYKLLKPNQKITSFPRTCDLLAHKSTHPGAVRKHYERKGFELPSRDHFMVGRTYFMNDLQDRIEFEALVQSWKKQEGASEKWLVKPGGGYARRGHGIFNYERSCGHMLAANPAAAGCQAQYRLTDEHLVQEFLESALSVNDHFMTARWVFLIASLEPLRVYALPLVVITAAQPLKKDALGGVDLGDVETFITNSDLASEMMETRHSWLWFINDFIEDRALAQYIEEETEKLVMMTLFPVLSELRRSSGLLYNASFAAHQLIGMDFAFDGQWTPKLIEHNCRPDVSLTELDICLDVFHQIRQFSLDASGIISSSRDFAAELNFLRDHIDELIKQTPEVASLTNDERAHLALSLFEGIQLKQYPRWRKIFPPVASPHLLPEYRRAFAFSSLDELFLQEVASVTQNVASEIEVEELLL
ncbi:MAG: hypothetical protein Q8P67_15975 [archaeon]|nr:hypothetical protein [archaeon]